jgi:hypothetical protein
MLDRYCVIDEERNRQYLLEKTQHLVGGFGKGVGDPPGKAKCFFEQHLDTNRISQICFTRILAWSRLHFRARLDLPGLILRWSRLKGLLSI